MGSRYLLAKVCDGSPETPAKPDPRGNEPNTEYENLQFFFHSDHLGSTSYMTDLSGEVSQHVEYFPYGGLMVEERSSSTENPYLFNGKELDMETGLYYYWARYYEPNSSVWLGVDELAEKYPGISGYTYVAGNPIMYIDPDGRDWVKSEIAKTLNEITDFLGFGKPFREINWNDNINSQEDFNKSGISGIYLGKAAVVFEGSENEKLGKGDNLFGEGANLAKVTVYGAEGENDIMEYKGYTMSSDPSKYGTVEDGIYNVSYDKVGKSGILKSNWAVEGRNKVPARNGVNPAFPNREPAYLNGVFIHRSNNSGYAGGGVSKGCPLIVPSFNNSENGWDEFTKQLEGVKQFKMILKRD